MRATYNVSASITPPGKYTSAMANEGGSLIVADTYENELDVDAMLVEFDKHVATVRMAVRASLLEELAVDRRAAAKAKASAAL